MSSENRLSRIIFATATLAGVWTGINAYNSDVTKSDLQQALNIKTTTITQPVKPEIVISEPDNVTLVTKTLDSLRNEFGSHPIFKFIDENPYLINELISKDSVDQDRFDGLNYPYTHQSTITDPLLTDYLSFSQTLVGPRGHFSELYQYLNGDTWMRNFASMNGEGMNVFVNKELDDIYQSIQEYQVAKKNVDSDLAFQDTLQESTNNSDYETLKKNILKAEADMNSSIINTNSKTINITTNTQAPVLVADNDILKQQVDNETNKENLLISATFLLALTAGISSVKILFSREIQKRKNSEKRKNAEKSKNNNEYANNLATDEEITTLAQLLSKQKNTKE
ncbi:MAG TPA: hypothetical protein VG895_01175 [Patescibacteria group bacterium]|nr:hypothetical protein [Patescibacteria group bacterium]